VAISLRGGDIVARRSVPLTLRTLRAAVIGLGFVGRAQVDALRRIPGVEVVAVCGSTERIHAQAEELGIPRGYSDYRALLASPEVDVVHNCTPNHVHFSINRAVLEAGKACFAEKPLTVTSDEAALLVQLARRSRAQVAVNFNHRGFPQVQEARAMVAAGDLGEVYAVHGSYLQDWLLSANAWNWRVDPNLGGATRTIADIGSHWMDLAQTVAGSRIVEVMADLHIAIPLRQSPSGTVRVETEDFASVLLRFANGAHGSFSVSEISAGHKNQLRLELNGARGALAWNSEESERLWWGSHMEPAKLLQRNPATALVPGTSVLPAGHAEGWNDALHTTIAGYYAMLRGGQPPAWLATWEDGWRAVALTEAIVASHREGRWTTVPEAPAETQSS
jgi:predicted dehydrogenase